MPGIDWPGLDDVSRRTLVQTIRKKEPPVLHRFPKELIALIPPLEKRLTPAQFAEHARAIIRQHNLILPDEVLVLIDEVAAVQSRPASPEHFIALFEELLDNITLKDERSTECGVWVINPMDAAGLRFNSVFIAGMDSRNFPQIPKADSLLNKSERDLLKRFLTGRHIACPRLTLSETSEALLHEEILFMTAMSTARERLTFSYTQTGADGKEQAAGEFFERIRGLTGGEKPALGESFNTILPVGSCRAADEIRQTQAWLAAAKMPHAQAGIQPSTSGMNPDTEKLIQTWLKNNPEFSATALESLARNRFVFFLEKMLRIKPDLTHEDDTSPMDRGSILHDILEQVYMAIAERSDLYADASTDRWKIAQAGEIKLAVLRPDQADELLALARTIALEEFFKAERRPSRHLGHPTIWETEKQKLLQIIENVVRMDLDTAQAERRYPALFEMKFDAEHQLPVTLTRNGEQIRLKGKIDRVDLIFNEHDELERLLVVDYKSKSRGVPSAQLEKEIECNLDCQLPLYTFAVQERFFGAHNTPELNEKTTAIYHLQERDLKKMSLHFEKKRLTMNPALTDLFLDTLFSNVRKLHAGDLATEPLIAHYEDYSHICRTTAIDPKEWLNETSV